MHAKIDYELDKPVFEPLQSDDCIELRMYKLITAANLSSLPARFPNIEIALRIYLCLMVTNCPGERSFSKLKRIENTFNDASGSFESPDTDELGALGVTSDGPVLQLFKKGTKGFCPPKFCDQQL